MRDLAFSLDGKRLASGGSDHTVRVWRLGENTVARAPASAGAHETARIIRGMLDERGCAAVVEEVPAYRSYAWPIGLPCAVGAGSAVLARLSLCDGSASFRG